MTGLYLFGCLFWLGGFVRAEADPVGAAVLFSIGTVIVILAALTEASMKE